MEYNTVQMRNFFAKTYADELLSIQLVVLFQVQEVMVFLEPEKQLTLFRIHFQQLYVLGLAGN